MAIETIAVLGAGQMGSGIAQIAAANGYKVIMRDIKQEFCDKGVATIKAGLDRQVAKGKTTQEAADAILANISTSFMAYTGLKKCMPMQRSGFTVAPVISVMDMEEVLVQRMASGLQISPS